MKRSMLSVTALAAGLMVTAHGEAGNGWNSWSNWSNILNQSLTEAWVAETLWDGNCPAEWISARLDSTQSRGKTWTTRSKPWDPLSDMDKPGSVPALAVYTRSASESYHVATWRDESYDKRRPWTEQPSIVSLSINRCGDDGYIDSWSGSANPSSVDTDAMGVTIVTATVTIVNYATYEEETHVVEFSVESGDQAHPSKDVYGNKSPTYQWIQYSHGYWVQGGGASITLDDVAYDAVSSVGKYLQTMYEAQKQ